MNLFIMWLVSIWATTTLSIYFALAIEYWAEWQLNGRPDASFLPEAILLSLIPVINIILLGGILNIMFEEIFKEDENDGSGPYLD